MPLHSALEIANEFIRRAHDEGRSVTQMHIQKFVYLAHGWCIAMTGKPLVEDDVEAWEYGPVIRKLYDALRHYGIQRITRPIRWGDDTPFKLDDGDEAIAHLTADEGPIIDRVWSVYKEYEAFQLSALTHADGSPWRNFFVEGGRNRVIHNDAIGEYFSELAARAE